MDDTSVTDDFGGVCNLYLVDTNTGPNRACHDIWVIYLEADASMTETLAMGVPLTTKALGTNLAVTWYQGSTMITYPPETVPGTDYLIDCEYQNNLSQIPCLFCLMPFDAVENKDIGSWHSSLFTIAYH